MKLKMGCCPTMLKSAKEIATKNDFPLEDYGSAANVLHLLRAGVIDIGVIGRKAKAQEFTGYVKQLAKGYTLISIRKEMLAKEDLPDLKVQTTLLKEIVQKDFPDLRNVVYHEELPKQLVEGDVWLIDWDDWKDDYNLLIPVNENYTKDNRFRVPFLYAREDVFQDGMLFEK